MPRQVAPQLDDVLHGCESHGVAAQAAYNSASTTDVMFKSPAGLRELHRRFLRNSTPCLGAAEVMNFPGPSLVGKVRGQVVFCFVEPLT